MSYDVSAIIPVLGPQPLLQRAIDSALSNAWIGELIVVDDGSAEPLSVASHPKVRVIRHGNNKGPGAARNTGARAAACNWLAFLDADDVWDKDKTLTQIEALKMDSSGAIGAVCAFGFLRGGNRVVCRPPNTRLDFDCALAGARFGLGSTMVISRAAFLLSNGYDDSYLRYEDWEWLLRILKGGHFLTLQQELVTVSLGNRAKPSVALDALGRLLKKELAGELTPSQARIFNAGIGLERASLQLAGGQRITAAKSILTAMLNRPAWVARAVVRRLAGGAIPGV